MQTRGVVTLVPTVLLCLPSLAGTVVILGNGLFHRHIEQWGILSAVWIASAVFIGWPLVAMAAVIGGLVGLSDRVSQRVKYAHYIIVGLATLATFSLTFHFGM
jgi:hypothetical protein